MILYREQVHSLVTGRREVRALEKTWKEEESYLKILKELYPQGKVEANCFRIGSSGDEGRRMSFMLDSGMWTDFSESEAKNGLFNFLWELEGWEGICRLARVTPLDFDFVAFTGAPIKEDGIHRLAMKHQWMVARKWDYVDADGYLLGKRIRYEMSNGEKQFRTLAYRTRKVSTDHNGVTREFQEGWRLDGGWGPLDPLYISPEDVKSDKPLLLVEGEKATDAARELVGSEYAVATWGGGAAGSPKKAFWENVKDRPKYYWPDKDAPGKRSAVKICEIDKKAKVVQVWGLPDLNDKDDLADVDATKRQWVLDLLKDAPYGITPAAEIVGRRYIYIIDTEQFIDLSNTTRLSPMALRRAHRHEVEQMDEELLSDPTTEKLACVTYWPGQERFVVEEHGTAEARKFNLWTDGGCEAHSGEPELFNNHMALLFPDEIARGHILDYFACIVQRPGVKIHWAPLIKGKQGIGKSYLLRVMKHVLGRTNVREVTTEEITSEFNPWAEASQIVFIEEIMAIGRREITNKLKPIVTSPTITINDKGVKRYVIPNRMNLCLFSNEEVPLLLDDDDRRFFVYESPLRDQGEEYYNRLFDALDEHELHLIRGLLENRDISKFNPKGKAPGSESKLKMQGDAETPVLSLMRAYVNARRTPFERDVVDLLDVVDWVNGQKGVRPGEGTPRSAAKFLAKLGAVKQDDIIENDNLVQMFVIRNHVNYGVAVG